MKLNIKVFTNNLFRDFAGADRYLSFNFSLPKELVTEVDMLRLKHDCLFLNTCHDVELAVTGHFSSLQSWSYVENTLNKRHVYDYALCDSVDLYETLNVFSSFAIAVRSKANQIGIESSLNFIWSHNINSEFSSPTMSFHRYNPSDVFIDFESLDSFEEERIIGLRM